MNTIFEQIKGGFTCYAKNVSERRRDHPPHRRNQLPRQNPLPHGREGKHAGKGAAADPKRSGFTERKREKQLPQMEMIWYNK